MALYKTDEFGEDLALWSCLMPLNIDFVCSDTSMAISVTCSSQLAGIHVKCVHYLLTFALQEAFININD